MKQRLALLLVVAVLLLAGCSNQAPTKLSDYGSFSQVDCKDAPTIIVAIRYAETTPEGTNPNKELKEWLPTGMTADEAVRSLEERCLAPTPSVTPRATETTSPSPTATAAPSPSATPTTSSPSATPSQNPSPTRDSTLYAGNIKTWEQAFEQAPEEITHWIFSSDSPTWRDAESWPKARSQNGNKIDARAIVTFNQNVSEDEARGRAGMPKEVDVVKADSCRVVFGNPEACSGEEVITILAPLQFDQSGNPLPYKYGVGLSLGTRVAIIEYE